jgi:hypothetical protein
VNTTTESIAALPRQNILQTADNIRTLVLREFHKQDVPPFGMFWWPWICIGGSVN